MHLQDFNYNGVTIQQRANDKYLNGTQMCSVNGKLIADWIRLKSTKAYMVELSGAMGIPIADLVEVRNGNQSWVHPSLAINLARWISPQFAVWCDAHIFHLMETGQTSLDIDPLEEMRLRVELAKYEAQKEVAIQKAIELRNIIVKTCPEPVQQKILGYQVVEVTKYRDRVLLDDEVIRAGDTITKTELCRRYGYLTRNGKPDYKRLNYALSMCRLPSEAWKLTAAIRENSELREEYLEELDRQIVPGDRQLFLGE